MKKKWRFLVVLLLMAALLLPEMGPEALAAGDKVSVNVTAKYLYEDARGMLPLINAFRTGNDAWYIGTDNRTRISVPGLKPLEYDYELEKTAMLRALEISVMYSHTRPSGSSWSTAYPFPVGRFYMGENAAYGYGTAAAVFKAFREDNEGYAGQGHRRNMLMKEYTRVGFGAVRVGAFIYWAQEFASGKAGGSAQRMSVNKVNASWGTLLRSNIRITTAEDELVMVKGTTMKMPNAYLFSDSGARHTLTGLKWKPAKSKFVRVKKNQLYAKKKGTTKLTATVAGQKLRMSVKVVSASEYVPDSAGMDIEDYDTPLGDSEIEYFYVAEEEQCFLAPTEDQPEAPAEEAGAGETEAPAEETEAEMTEAPAEEADAETTEAPAEAPEEAATEAPAQ